MNESTREGWTVVCVHGRMDRWIDGLDAFALTNDENPPNRETIQTCCECIIRVPIGEKHLSQPQCCSNTPSTGSGFAQCHELS